MTRPFILAFATLAMLIIGGVASAQVAAPNLSPVPYPNLFRPDNPAVVPWRPNSHVGVTLGRVEFRNNLSPINPIAEGSANQFDLSWVGGAFGLALSQFDLNAEIDPLFGGGAQAIQQTNLHLGLRLWDMVGIGLGQDKQEDKSTPTPGPTETLPLVGANVRLAEVIYLGAAAGTQTVTETGNPDYEQGVLRYGVALLVGDTNRFHVEWYHESVDAYQDAALFIFRDGREADGITVEAAFDAFLLGYESRDVDFVDINGTVTDTNKFNTLSVGWFPAQGLSLGVFAAKIEASGGNLDIPIRGIHAGWAF